MDNPVETFEVDGLTVNIYPDYGAESPLDWGSEPALLTFTRDCGLGERGTGDVAEWTAEQAFNVDCSPVAGAMACRYDDYGSSGSRIRETDWDDGRANCVLYVTPKHATEWGCDVPGVRVNLEGMLETLNQFLEGDVYGYVVEDKNGEDLDSCWGFYGFDYCMGEARSAAESCAEQVKKEQAELIAQI